VFGVGGWGVGGGGVGWCVWVGVVFVFWGGVGWLVGFVGG
jgi:hypothetical protein